ncbi:unnamed protein product [Clonostachys solani]|uniref:Clr5 domain-containing protein n=1 Tax=Clonostachys solani TaxID=160281 RepID=A0A9P0EFP0_9HYPO|nr:unnamed protein product [Clonostachys solani]
MSAPKIPPSEWEKYRQVVRSLYVDKNLPLDALVKEMETAHGFIATKSQYIRKLAAWKIGKNATTIAWKKAAVVIEKRKRQGKESEICIDGKLIPCKKMKKEIARHRPPLPEILEMSAHEIDLPGDFLVRTPPATTFHPTQLHQWKMQLHGLPWMKFRDAFMSCSTLFAGSGLGNAPMDLVTNFLARIPNLTTIATASRTVEHYDRILPLKLGNRVPATENSLRDGFWPHFILYFVYLASNNLLGRQLVRDTLGWIDSTKNIQVIKALLQFKGPTIEICTSALFSGAICNESASIVQFFLRNGYDPDTSPHHCYIHDGPTMLEIAIGTRNITVIRLLLEFGANQTLTTKSGHTLLRLAIEKGDDTIIRILLGNGADPTNALCIASYGSLASYVDSSCDEDIIQLLLEAGASIDGESPGPVIIDDDEEHCYFNDVPLVIAAHTHNTRVARFLLRAGANVNQVDTEEGSAIQNAVKNGDMNMVKLLVEAGAEVNLNKERYSDAWASWASWALYIATPFFSPLQLATQANNFGMIKYLLQCNADTNDLPALEILEKDLRSGDYETPLSYAVLGNNLQIATLLLDSGANPDAVSLHGHTALGVACRVENVHMIKLLLAYGATPQYHLGPESGSSPLQVAILHKDPTLVDDLLQRGADINSPAFFEGGRTALQAAAEAGNAPLFKLLINMGADINLPAAAENGVTCLQAAMLSGNDEIIETIMNYGGTATADSILCAVKMRSPKMVDFAMGLGADVNSPGFAYLGLKIKHLLVVTPLVLAIYNQDFDMTHKLLLSGANVSPIDCESGSILPLHQAIRARNLPITKILLSFGADPNQLEPRSGESSLGMATSFHLDYGRYFPLVEGRVDPELMTPIIRELISHAADVNLMAKGIYPIENVIRSYELMEIFLEAGADIHAPKNSLLARAICGEFSTVGLLLDNDANVNGQDKKCGTPLQAAITIDNVELVSELLARGANVNADLSNLVAYAVELKQPRIVELLLEKDADTNGISPSKQDGWHLISRKLDSYDGEKTALMAAAEQNNFELVKALIERGANVEADKAPWGATPLQAASIHDNLPMVLMLLDRGADVNAKPRGHIRRYNEQLGCLKSWWFGRRTALQAASENQNLQLAQLLIEKGAKVNMEPYEDSGATALQLAAINGDIQMAALLLEKGAKVNAAGSSYGGRTALVGAAEHGRLDMVYLLLQNDQDETGLEVRCEKAAKYAEREGHSIIAKILRKWKGPGSVV